MTPLSIFFVGDFAFFGILAKCDKRKKYRRFRRFRELRSCLRKPSLYPLSYGGMSGSWSRLGFLQYTRCMIEWNSEERGSIFVIRKLTVCRFPLNRGFDERVRH